MLLSVLALFAAAHSADTTRWIVSNHGREAGDLVLVRAADSAVVRWVFTDRNRGTRLEMRYRFGSDGRLASGEQRPVLADGTTGAPSDAFSTSADSIWYGVANGANGANGARRVGLKRDPAAFVGARGGTPWEQALLARFLLGRPGLTSPVAGGGTARAEVIADTTLRDGKTRQRARLVMIYRGAQPTPTGIWLDERGELLATDVQWFIIVRPSAERFLPALRAIELRWRNAVGEAVAQKVVTKVDGALVLKNGDLFDSERGVMVPQQTVVVRGDRIVAVGPAASTPVPDGATVIDATGKTIMPGMWEMHTHLQVANQSALSLMQLAQGLTTARDLASDVDVAVSQRNREREGKLASPRIILGGFMEGPLKWAGPTEAVVATEAQARAWVARYDSLGYRQIKLYNVTHPDLVPVIAAEAHKRGMLLSGHVPRGLTMQAAVALGYDEIQHAAFFFSNFFQDSLYVPYMRAYSQVATAVAPSFDVSSPAMSTLIDYLAARRTVIDGTFNLWIGGGGALVGAGGSTNQERADSAYMQIIRRLYAAGVPLVAGTDNSAGVTYRRELEMYEKAGIPVPKILQIATIDAARIMSDGREYGSVRVGKVADILLVAGRPAERISDLQKLETVIRGGRYYKVSDLQKYAFARGQSALNALEGGDLCPGHDEP
ncbi:MAG: amidohydrolase family protein [Gemmatimonadota bacterium]|nr:amidohydrolase family protein [Gemmatimonadota bacterium]